MKNGMQFLFLDSPLLTTPYSLLTAFRKESHWMTIKYLKNVATLCTYPERCIGCSLCVDVCPHRILSLVEGKIFIADRDLCMECGACTRNCPVTAVAVRAGVGCAQAVFTAKRNGGKPCCGGEENCCG